MNYTTEVRYKFGYKYSTILGTSFGPSLDLDGRIDGPYFGANFGDAASCGALWNTGTVFRPFRVFLSCFAVPLRFPDYDYSTTLAGIHRPQQ